MSTTAETTQTFEQKYHFLLRKLHSLSGIVPIGAFLIEHLLTNSMAFKGREHFNADVRWIHGLPYLPFVETLFIFLPLAFHALYGIRIAMTAKPNSGQYPYMANWRYTLQRVTGYVAFLFIVVHLAKFRFAHLLGWGPEFIHEGNDYFEITRRGLMEWRPWGVVVPATATFAFYYVGLLASVYHFCNGIWSFCISWGITVGERAQRRIGFAAAGLGAVLLVWGALTLYAFRYAEPRSSTRVPMHVESEPAQPSGKLVRSN